MSKHNRERRRLNRLNKDRAPPKESFNYHWQPSEAETKAIEAARLRTLEQSRERQQIAHIRSRISLPPGTPDRSVNEPLTGFFIGPEGQREEFLEWCGRCGQRMIVELSPYHANHFEPGTGCCNECLLAQVNQVGKCFMEWCSEQASFYICDRHQQMLSKVAKNKLAKINDSQNKNDQAKILFTCVNSIVRNHGWGR